MRYFVKDRLPPITARIQQAPVALSTAGSLAALRYTFIAEPGHPPTSLRQALLENSDPAPLFRLYDAFGPSWWMQRSPYVFRLAQEYDRVLPVHLVMDPAAMIKKTVERLHPDMTRLGSVEVGDMVQVAAFDHAERRGDGSAWTLFTRPVPGQPPLRFRWNGAVLPANTCARVIATRGSLLDEWTEDLAKI